MLERHEALCRDFPRDATFHNDLAWLAANLDRDLDKALAHAQRRLNLSPRHQAYWTPWPKSSFAVEARTKPTRSPSCTSPARNWGRAGRPRRRPFISDRPTRCGRTIPAHNPSRCPTRNPRSRTAWRSGEGPESGVHRRGLLRPRRRAHAAPDQDSANGGGLVARAGALRMRVAFSSAAARAQRDCRLFRGPHRISPSPGRNP